MCCTDSQPSASYPSKKTRNEKHRYRMSMTIYDTNGHRTTTAEECWSQSLSTQVRAARANKTITFTS